VPQCVPIVSGFPKLDLFRCEVCWHVNLWHYRSSNPSPNSRIAVAGVWSNLEINGDLSRPLRKWGMKNGERCESFSPEGFEVVGDQPLQPEPHLWF